MAGGKGRLFKSPNCVSCGLSLVLKAVQLRYGIDQVSVTTFQTLSGRGDLKYDLNLVKGNVYPLRGTIEDTDAYILREVKSIVGGDFKISVTAQRVFAQRGHFVDVRVKTKRPVGDVEEAIDAFEQFHPFRATPFEGLPSVPNRPIRVVRDSGFPRPVQTVESEQNEAGMSVFVGQVNTNDEVFDLTFSFVVDNIARGAYGAALINAECYFRLESIQANEPSKVGMLVPSTLIAIANLFRHFVPLSSREVVTSHDPTDFAIHM
jgi:aspartate-semialdehyde dehydrogenase